MVKTSIVASLRRYWWMVVTGGILGAVLALAVSSALTPLYRSTTTLYFTLNFGNSANDLAQGSAYTANQMTSFGELALSPVVLQPVVEELALDMSVVDLASAVSVSTPRDTVLMDISVRNQNPQRASDIANAIARRLKVTVEEYAPQMSSGRSSVTVRTVAQAQQPAHPFSPNHVSNIALGLLAGLLFGVLAAAVAPKLDNRVRNSTALAELTKVTFLGSLRKRPDATGNEATVLLDPMGEAAEDYRRVRSSLRYAILNRSPVVIVVSSSTAGEGKSTVSINLAAALAESGSRVLLIDADLRRGRIADYAQVDGAIGLSQVLVGQVYIRDAIQPFGDSGVDIMASGEVPPNPGELLASKQMEAIIQAAKGHYDTILIDTAPVLAVADALAMIHFGDGLVFVSRAGFTKKQDLARSLATIDSVGATIFGIVLNGVNPTRADQSDYYSHSVIDQTRPRSGLFSSSNGAGGPRASNRPRS